MNVKKMITCTAITLFFTSLAPAIPVFAAPHNIIEQKFDTPIDAFSVRMMKTSFFFSTKTDNTWSDWQGYEDDGDAGVGEESELIMVPQGTTAVRIKDIVRPSDIHPISVSHEPIKTRFAAVTSTEIPPVILRSDWGADERFLFHTTLEPTPANTDTSKGDNGGEAAAGAVNQRVKDCQSAQQNFPAEFSTTSKVTKDASGRSYRWPLQYSKEIQLLVVHHSALVIKDDPRPSVERVRALYKYHAMTKSWGDIGYNFIVDEQGKVYEGRVGGKYVVGGHAYCNNVGTIGIVLLGNFEIEQPSDAQTKSLQRLLASLANDYHLDTTKSVQFHGKKFSSPIVRHRDVLSTLCPGYYVAETFGQIIKNVQSGNLNTSIIFPQKSSSYSSSSPTILNSPDALKPASGISFIGRSGIAINPGGKQRLSFMYTADQSGAYEGKKVADIKLSNQHIKLWLDNGLVQIPIMKGVLLHSDLPAFETADLQLIVQAPMDAGVYTMDIGGLHFTLSVTGRRTRTGEFINPFSGNNALIVLPKATKKNTEIVARVRPQSRTSTQTVSLASSASSSAVSSASFVVHASKKIRIRLSAGVSPTIIFSDQGLIHDAIVRGGTTFDIFPRGNECEVRNKGERVLSDTIIRFSSSVSGVLTMPDIAGRTRSYRGTIECRVVNGTIAIINELPLEEYMAGLSEEPDTEPYEKQRAFAIAARTYAAHYMDSMNRKFIGMPYDGSDDPALFQVYAGVNFTDANPNWLRAVKSTAGDVLMFDQKIIKPPYFSSDDGRTRSPSEAGWKNFPFASIFTSKPDPWCSGMTLRGHGVGMSGCGAKAQANEGKSAEQILQYYYPGTLLGRY